MKKTLFLSAMVLSSVSAFADCTVELQYQGTILGQNSFSSPICREAVRACKRAEMRYSKVHLLPQEELSCVTYNDVVVTPDPTGDADNHSMSRYKALRLLEDIEGDSTQGEENFEIIMNYVNNGQVSLKNGVHSFIQILKAAGSNNTSSARSAFDLVMRASNSTNLAPLMISRQLGMNIKIEGDASQSIGTFNTLTNLSSKHNLDLIDAMAQFDRVLLTVGSGDTASARLIFNEVAKTKSAKTRLSVVVDTAIKIEKIENNGAQTAENIQLVNKASRKRGVRFSEASETMIDLLNRHGAGETSAIQSKFIKIFGL